MNLLQTIKAFFESLLKKLGLVEKEVIIAPLVPEQVVNLDSSQIPTLSTDQIISLDTTQVVVLTTTQV